MADHEAPYFSREWKHGYIKSSLVEKFPYSSRGGIKGERKKDSCKKLVSELVFVVPIYVTNP